MKVLKALTVIAVSGTVIASAHGIGNNRDCNNQPQERSKQHQMNDRHNQYKKFNRKNPNRRIYRAFRQLNLTDSQKEQLKEIKISMLKERRSKRKRFRGMTNIRNFLSVDGFDKENFTYAASNRAREMIKTSAEMIDKAIAILTPEQRLELIDKLGKKGKRKAHQ